MLRYLLVDFYRMITAWQFWCGSLGVGVTLTFSGLQAGRIADVYSAYLYNGMFSTYILCFAFCALSFSGCFVEDGEYGYWNLVVQKGGLSKYVWSKICTCFISGIATMVLGMIIFLILLSLKVPLYMDYSWLVYERPEDTFGFLIYEDTIVLYFICSALKSGVLGGLFAVLSAFLTLFERNRLFTISVPIVGYYFIENTVSNILRLPDICNIWLIYSAGYSLFHDTIKDIVYAILAAGLVIITIEYFVERKLRREILDEKSMAGNKK